MISSCLLLPVGRLGRSRAIPGFRQRQSAYKTRQRIQHDQLPCSPATRKQRCHNKQSFFTPSPHPHPTPTPRIQKSEAYVVCYQRFTPYLKTDQPVGSKPPPADETKTVSLALAGPPDTRQKPKQAQHYNAVCTNSRLNAINRP